MPVPKIVENGLNSPFLIWGQFWAAYLFCGRDLAETPCFLLSLNMAKTSPSNKPVLGSKEQKKNKNHFIPI
jgi:hypothetical protein